MTTNYLRVLCVVTGLQAAAMAQGGWTQVATSGPTSRHYPSMAYDSQRGRTVLFGGYSANATPLGDTWEWNGSQWQPNIFASGPSARWGHTMIYDSQGQRIILFGGVSSSAFGDTWQWNGTSWAQAASTGPSARDSHAMVYDSLRGRAVLFGGHYGNNIPLSDTWEWNGSSWAQVAISGPSARWGHAMAYDSMRGRTVLFGGYIVNGSVLLGDTWEWDGQTWHQQLSAAPTVRTVHAMAYDSHYQQTVLFGGLVEGGLASSETWQWNGSTWIQAPTAGPSARFGHAMAYDSGRRRLVLFGGGGLSGYPIDTWEREGALLSTAIHFGTGCGSPALLLSAITGGGPIINSMAQVAMTNIPSSIAFVALGWSRTTVGAFPLPLSLNSYGMPGCSLLQSCEAAAQPVTVTGTGAAAYSLQLPNWPGLLGLHIYLQGWASAPGANNAGVIVSNGLEWVIGNS